MKKAHSKWYGKSVTELHERALIDKLLAFSRKMDALCSALLCERKTKAPTGTILTLTDTSTIHGNTIHIFTGHRVKTLRIVRRLKNNRLLVRPL